MRSLSRDAKFDKRVEVIELRGAGRSYAQIASQLNLSRTGVFDICKRHEALGAAALHDAPHGRARGEGRLLTPSQELLIRQQIETNTPDELAMSEALWTQTAVSRLIEQRLGRALPVRTLGLYLARWGFAARRPTLEPAGPRSPRRVRWLSDAYPAVAARSRAEGSEIHWGGQREVATVLAAPGSARHSRRGGSMIFSVTNKGRLRWITFGGPLDADTLVDFLRRLIRGREQKLLLVMDGLRVADEAAVTRWLAEQEDAIEVFHLPAETLPGAA